MPSTVTEVPPECLPLLTVAQESPQKREARHGNGSLGIKVDSSDLSPNPTQDHIAECVHDLVGNAFSGRPIVNRNSSLDDQLFNAIKDGKEISEIHRLLLENAAQNAGDSALNVNCVQIAMKSRRADVLSLLFDHKADPNAIVEGKSLLHLAVEARDLDCLKVIAKRNVDQNIFGVEKKETPLMTAVNAEWLDGVSELMNHRPDLEKRGEKSKKTVLQLAVATKNMEMISLIVSRLRSFDNYHSIINVLNAKGMSPLFISIIENNLALVKLFLGARADVSLLDSSKRNVLHWTAEKGNLEIMEQLFNVNPDEMANLVEQKCEGKLKATPLHLAITRGHEKIVRYLLEKAKVSITYKTTIDTHKNCNLIHIASDSDRLEVLKYFASLLNDSRHEMRNLVQEVTSCGETPLHFALKRRQIDLVYALIAAGSDLTAKFVDKNNCGRTAIDILIYKVPSSVEIISNVLDKSITKKKKSTSVIVDYSVLMPPRETELSRVFKGDSFRVMKALQKTGDRVGQRKLLEHPLVESFVYLHWKRLAGLYYTLVILHALYAFFLSLFLLSKLSVTVNLALHWTLLVSMCVFLAPLLIHELQCAVKTQPITYRAESLLKFLCFGLSIAACFPEVPNELSAFAVLLAWFELVLLISRIPRYGHYMLMFIEIAFKYLKLLLSFVFALFGFVVAFMTIFGPGGQFDSFWTTVVKVIVMMTNELEYDSFHKDFSAGKPPTFSYVIAMLVFILFVVFMTLVLTNLFVAVAVDDIKKLHIISKQASFLGAYDVFLLSGPNSRATIGLLFSGVCAVVRKFSPKLVYRWEYFQEVKPVYEINVLIDEEFVPFPEDLTSALIGKGYENSDRIIKEYRENEEKRKLVESREKINKEERERLLSDIETMLRSFQSGINSKLSG